MMLLPEQPQVPGAPIRGLGEGEAAPYFEGGRGKSRGCWILIQLHSEDVEAVVESVTAHAEKGAWTKTTLYVGHEEEEDVEEEAEEVEEVGGGRVKDKAHQPLMISVRKVRIRPGKGKGKSNAWFPQPLNHNTRRVCFGDPQTKFPMHSLCPTKMWCP